MSRLKKYAFLLLLWAVSYLLFCQENEVIWAMEEMTDAEIIAELMTNLESREILANERELILNEREQSLNQRELKLNLKEDSIINRENLQSEKEKSSTVIETYWQNLKDDKRSDYWTGFLHGSLTGIPLGFISGGYVGIKIGITLE